MQIGRAYSTATPRTALMESRRPVCWISNRDRRPVYDRPAQMPTPSSSLQTRMRRGAAACESGRSRPSLVVMSGTERTNSIRLALISAMMLLPRRKPSGLRISVLTPCCICGSSPTGFDRMSEIYSIFRERQGGQDRLLQRRTVYKPCAILPTRSNLSVLTAWAKSRETTTQTPALRQAILPTLPPPYPPPHAGEGREGVIQRRYGRPRQSPPICGSRLRKTPRTPAACRCLVECRAAQTGPEAPPTPRFR